MRTGRTYLNRVFLMGIILLFVCAEKSAAQCSGCTVNIINNTIPTYVVAPGTTVCVASGLNYTGTITLSGGTLCNEGTVHNLNLNSGTFNNYGIFQKPSGTQTIANTGKLVINSFGITGASPPNGIDLVNLDIQSVNTNDSVIIYQYKGSIINISKDFTASKGVIRIVTGLTNPGAGSYISTSTLGVGKAFTISGTAQFYLTNNTAGIINWGKAATLDGSRNKTVTNYGTINCNNSFNISGNGLGFGLVQIFNQSGASFNVATNFSNSMNNATVTIVNSGTVTIQNNYTQSGNASTVATFTNSGSLTTNKDITLTVGSLVNQSAITSRNIDVNASMTNTTAGCITTNNKFIISGTGAVFTNNGAMIASSLFKNGETANFGARSFLRAGNFTNQNTGTINGPTSIGGNDSNYAFVMIDTTSTNHSYLNGYLSIWDITPPGSGTIKLDVHTNDSRIASTVIWNPPCPFINLTPTTSSSLPRCYGQTASLSVSAALVRVIPPCVNINFALTPSGSYTWNPGGLTGSSVTTPTLAATTVYTVSAPFFSGACTASNTISIPVTPPVAVTSGTMCAGSSVLLTATNASSYSWTPSTGLSGTGSATVTASPSVTTIYTVTGVNGSCTTTATSTVTVIPNPTITVNSGTVCSGSSINLIASGAASIPGPGTYSWTPSTGLSSTTGATVTATPPATTVYTVTGTAVSGCSGTATATVTVIPNPTITVNSPSICSGTSATLTASGASTYTWTPATGLSATTGSTVTASPTVTTVYTVSGTASGCTGTATATVTVGSGAVIVTVNSATIFIGGTATLTASGATTYSWAPGTGLSSTTGNTVTAMPVTTTTYIVTGNISGCTGTDTSVVTVIPAPIPSGNPLSCFCVSSFAPTPGKKYLISAWVREDNASPTKLSFDRPAIFLDYGDVNYSFVSTTGPIKATGAIIDGWQRVEQIFTVPTNAYFMSIRLQSASGDVLFDDIRVFPFDGSMKTYVYDPTTLRLVAELDERNYATQYEYDEEGKLTRVKKETEKGTMTIKESRNSAPKQ